MLPKQAANPQKSGSTAHDVKGGAPGSKRTSGGPRCKTIRVVQDNLSTHSAGALYQTFPPAEARRILRRIECHYTPKHASWLNMVEIEIGVLRGQCLDRRIDDPKRLRREIKAWERKRNAARSRIKWMFTTDKARAKMGRAYPATSKES
jgi:hypothetical protein